jgi:hypothetical protein
MWDVSQTHLAEIYGLQTTLVVMWKVAHYFASLIIHHILDCKVEINAIVGICTVHMEHPVVAPQNV